MQLGGKGRFAVTAGAGLLVAAGAAWSAFARDMEAARSRLAGRSTVLDSPFGPIEYAAEGSGPALLVIHGAGGGFDQGIDLTRPLAESGYRVIAPSRFGYLESARPQAASPALQADAFAWLLSHLGIACAGLIGGSAGTLSALEFAVRHPQMTQSLVLIVPVAYAPDRRPGESAFSGPVGESIVAGLMQSDFLYWLALQLAPDPLTRSVLGTDPALVRAAGGQEQARVRAILEHALPVSRRVRGLRDDAEWVYAPPRFPLEQILAPVLTISTEDDGYGSFATARHIAASVPNGQMASFPTGGHLWVGHQSEVRDAILRFLAATRAGRATDRS